MQTGHSPLPDGTGRAVNIGVVPTKPGVTQDDRLAWGRQKDEPDGLPVTPQVGACAQDWFGKLPFQTRVHPGLGQRSATVVSQGGVPAEGQGTDP